MTIIAFENCYNKTYNLQGTTMKRFIIIITCNLLTSITLATNNKDTLNELPINEDQNIQINNIEANNNGMPHHKIQELLKPNDIIITVASSPYTRMSPRIFYPHYNFQTRENFPDFFRYKTVGIISAIGSGITNYKIGDMINIEKLNNRSPVDNDPDNLNSSKNGFFFQPANNNKDIMPDLEENSTTAKVKLDFI
jgi:hypothetical protein